MKHENIKWGSLFLLDKRKLEKVQHHATKLVPQLRDKLYQHRLISLDLPSLYYRIRGDLIFLYIASYFNLDCSTFYSSPNVYT